MKRFLACVVMVAFATALPGAGQDMQSLESVDQGHGWGAVGRIDIGAAGFCTGTLIAEDLVLTAAHCLYDKRSGRRVEDADLTFLAGWRNGRADAYRRVTASLPHPEYRLDALPLQSVGSDLALLRLDHPIRLPRLQPLATGPADATAPLGILSYAQKRSEAPSLQRGCRIKAQQSGLMVLSCPVDFGASGAPVVSMTAGKAVVVSVVSAMAMLQGQPVALAVPLQAPLARLQAEMARAHPAPLGVRLLSNGAGGAKFIKVAP